MRSKYRPARQRPLYGCNKSTDSELAEAGTDRRTSCALLDADEKGMTTGDTLGGMQSLAKGRESGLYSLTLRSRKPGGQGLQEMGCLEMLPSICQIAL